MASQAAPGRLELVRAFVNSVDLEDGPEQLGAPAGLAAWLKAHDLPAGRVTAADLERAVAVREALRELLLANHGDHDAGPAASRVLEDAARRAALEVRFGDAGAATLAPGAGGVDGPLVPHGGLRQPRQGRGVPRSRAGSVLERDSPQGEPPLELGLDGQLAAELGLELQLALGVALLLAGRRH